MKKKYVSIMAVTMSMAVLVSGCGCGRKKAVTPTNEPETTNYTDFVSDMPQGTGEDLDASGNPISTDDAGSQTPEVTVEPKVEGTSIYYGNDNDDNMQCDVVSGDEVTPEFLVNQLIKHGVLAKNTKVNSIKEKTTKSGKELVVDFSDKFQEKLFTLGNTEELLMMSSVVNTFIQAYQANSMKITVNGNTVESGHCIYDGKMQFYQMDENANEEQMVEGISEALGL